MYLTRELTDLSLPAIAEAFNRRDHTTVLHAIRKVERGALEDARLSRAGRGAQLASSAAHGAMIVTEPIERISQRRLSTYPRHPQPLLLLGKPKIRQ